MNRLDECIQTFRRQDIHERGCNSSAPQPTQEGFQYDYYTVMHCDCFMSNITPTQAEKIAFLQKIAETFDWPHDKVCPATHPKFEQYRDKWVWVRMNCTCWLSKLEVDIQPHTGYDEVMISADPVPDLKKKVDQVRDQALGPHLDTPIYDQLVREYDEKFRATTYFDTALAEKLALMKGRQH